MTEPTPTVIQEAVVWRRGNDWEVAVIDDFLLSIGIDPDMPLSQLRERLQVGERVEHCLYVKQVTE